MARRTTDSAGVSLKVELSGDFFRRDPGDTLYTNIGNMLDALAGEMEAAVSGDIRAHKGAMKHSTDWTADHVKGYTVSGKTGKHWATWAAVGLPTTGMGRTDAIRTKAAGASIERRWHPFRRTKSAVYRMRAIASANLTEGMG